MLLRAATFLIPVMLLVGVLPSQAQIALSCGGPPPLVPTTNTNMICTASGGTAPYTYAITGGALPLDVFLNTVEGTITGPPRTLGPYSFEVTATDGVGLWAKVQISGTVYKSALFGCGTAYVDVGSRYGASCTYEGGAPPVSLTLEPMTPIPGGVVSYPRPDVVQIAGLATTAGEYRYMGKLTDAAGEWRSLVVSISVKPRLGMTCDATPGPAGVGVPYSLTCLATNGISPYTWRLYGSLPPGLSLTWTEGKGTSAVISGTPTQSGAYTFTLEVTDNAFDQLGIAKPVKSETTFEWYVSGSHPNIPTVSDIIPNSVPAGSPDTYFEVHGSSLAPDCMIAWDGEVRPTVQGSGQLLGVFIPWSDLKEPGSVHQVNVRCPGAENIAGVTVNVTAPRITSVEPNTAPLGSADINVVINGSGFLSGSIPTWNGAPLSGGYLSPTQLYAVIPADRLVVVGKYNIGESNPHGAKSPDTRPFIVGGHVISHVAPEFAVAGGPGFVLTVTGDGFNSGCAITWNSLNPATKYVSTNQLTATIGAPMIARPGTVSIAVVCSNVRSNSVIYSIYGPLISSLVPAAIPAGAPDTTLTVAGSNFAAGAAIRWNGDALPTTWISATRLTTVISAAKLANAGTYSVSVANPDGAVSLNALFTVVGTTTPFIQTVYNPANKQPVLAPGAPTFLEGLYLAADTFSASAAPWPTSMGGVQVTINGTPAPLRFVSPTAIVFQVPQTLAATGSVVVSAPGGVSTPLTVVFAKASFGVVANTPDTPWPPAIHRSDSTIISATNPAVPGETVTVYGVGAGVPSCSLADGTVPPSECTVQAPRIQLPDVYQSSAPSAAASLAPGSVGVARLDIDIPADLPSSVVASGSLRLLVECGDGSSQIVTLPLAASRSQR
jgi:uncharacterized protein (TIGR03437 family)